MTIPDIALGPFSRHDRTKWVVFGLSQQISYPESYAGSSLATGSVSLAGQDEGERSDEERQPGPPGWGGW